MSETSLPTDLVARIRAAADALRPELIADLQALVRIPSQTGDEEDAQNEVEAQYRRLGLEIDRWEPEVADLAAWAEHVTEVADYAGRPNVVGVWKGTGGGRSMILNAHIDTVESGDRAHWQHDGRGAHLGRHGHA